MSFPPDFLWGAATSAYQIEGSPLADGAGPSIWHRFSHTPGRTEHGATGDVACDHYRRWPEDVALLRELGFGAYRFSISWSRILPDGTGRVNEAGLDFYRGLVDALLDAGIQPCATLYHWDLPAALDDRGGWLNRDVADWFAEYARVVFRALDDRVPMWATLNEPWVVADGGYVHGSMAPGHRVIYEGPLAAHNQLRAHAAAVQAYRAEGKNRIGVVVNLEPKYPASDHPEDVRATRLADAYINRWFLDPIFQGEYPEEMREIFGAAWPELSAADLQHIRQPIDWLGVNYYSRRVVTADPDAWPVPARALPQRQHAHTEMGAEWEVYPEGLADALRWLTERYGRLPLYVTENGAAFYDPPSADGEIHDPLRVAYFREHLRAALGAMRDGVDLRGYFAWSLLDNFEWSHGYTKRFGVVHVDFANQRRTPKASARFLAEVIRTRGGALASAWLPDGGLQRPGRTPNPTLAPR